MASFASSATTCGARKHAWTNFKILLFCILQILVVPSAVVKEKCRSTHHRWEIEDNFWSNIYRKPLCYIERLSLSNKRLFVSYAHT